MNLKLAGAIAAGFLAAAGSGISPAGAATALVTFDPPTVPQGPSIYVAVPGPQTIVTAPATFSGGVVLGLATFFPAIAFASSPNVYGTADFGNGLSKTLRIDVNPSFLTTEVSFALFNGETFNQSYIVNAFNGNSLVASQTLANIAPNFNSGYALVDLIGAGITSVTVDAVGAPNVWDFLIDSIAFNQNVTSVINGPLPPVFQPPTPPVVIPVQVPDTNSHGQHRNRGRGHEGELVEINFGDDLTNIQGNFLVVTNTPAVPEPETYALMLAGLGLMGFVARRRKQKVAAA